MFTWLRSNESVRRRCTRWGLLLSALSAVACGDTGGAIRYQGGAVIAQGTLTKGKKTPAQPGNGDLSVSNESGAIFVDVSGPAGEVLVTAVPFAIGAADLAGRRQAAAAMNQALLTIQTLADGSLDVKSTGGPTYGADLVVHLPDPFRGSLTLNALDGNVTYWATPNSDSATINVAVGDIEVQNVGYVLNVQGGQGDILVVAAATLGGKGEVLAPSSIRTNDGNITARIPDAASLTIDASTASGGTVQPEANQVAEVAPGQRSARIVVGDGVGGSLTVATQKGDVFFLRP
jgi:hypothetical protein